jgi:hypothetical protein
MDTARAPFLTYGEVSHIDLTEIGDYVSKLANSGLIMSDPNLEDYLRELGGLPPADHNNAEAMGVAPKGKDEFLTDDEYALINDVADGGQTASPTEDVE